ncbi:signal transduction histidine kinase [Dyadobacter jejuensis]|uniref:histidine kinase n=1 Tax=Dyadobacter jejuensis TaxID=1082580 RepID=A0A316ADE6_9BACT|nr:HAMP domain-containing sensor histidine kinase [Dyadobacter jejuensis]PWJ54990.1 signal transduction histidine kinase [Dyadobacter jejuensis]
MKKLLDRSLNPLIIYSLVVLAGSIPAYYLIIDYTWTNELDKHHSAIKTKITNRLNGLDASQVDMAENIRMLNHLEPGFHLKRVAEAEIAPDRRYSEIRFDDFMQDREQFRGLVTFITIHGQSYRLTIETNMEEVDETIGIIAAVAIFFLVLLLGGFIYLNRRTSLKLWNPFYQTIDQLQRFQLNNQAQIDFPPTQIKEFDTLQKSLQALIDRNIKSFQLQKRFTENASHELQTPLAIIKSKLDLLLQQKELTATQAQLITSATESLNRVAKINKNLLLLAKIENHQFQNPVPVDLEEEIHAAVERFEELYEYKHPEFLLAVEPAAPLMADPTLVQILLNNLIQNACKYSPPKSVIGLQLNNNDLFIKNPGQAPLIEKELYSRFGQATRPDSGNGLGLAIAHEICRYYGWPITYAYTQGSHVFHIDFTSGDTAGLE